MSSCSGNGLVAVYIHSVSISPGALQQLYLQHWDSKSELEVARYHRLLIPLFWRPLAFSSQLQRGKQTTLPLCPVAPPRQALGGGRKMLFFFFFPARRRLMPDLDLA